MEGCDGTPDGRPDELTFRRYRRFGAGGAKLIWGEAAAVVEEGRANPRQLCAQRADRRPTSSRCSPTAAQAHRDAFGDDDDLLVGLQLTHSGRYSYRRPLLAMPRPAPRSAAYKATGRHAARSTDDDLKRLVDHYVAAAKLAAEVGFEFVDVKQCHRYLLNELLGARNRPGPYGGSFENRTRLARDIFRRSAPRCPAWSLATRLNVFDGIPYRKGAGRRRRAVPVDRRRWPTAGA